MFQISSQPRLRLGRLVLSFSFVAIIFSVSIYHGLSSVGGLGSVDSNLRLHAIQETSLKLRGSEPHLPQLISLYPSPPAQERGNIGLIPRATTWQDRVTKGGKIVCIFEAQDEDAASAINGGQPVASRFTSFNNLGRWGWLTDTSVSEFGTSLDVAFEALGINTAQNRPLGVLHEGEWKDNDGKEQQASFGYYTTTYNFQGGLIVADVNVSPQNMSPNLEAYPDLKQWSDLVFLQWQQEAGGNTQNLRYIIRAHVVNPDTQDIVFQALSRAGHTQLPSWNDRVTFQMNTDEGKAILGTPNGAGCGYLVAQHKTQLGVKRIRDVVVWVITPGAIPATPPEGGVDDPGLNLLFEIEDVPPPADG